jgi:predicted small secreted protein
VGETFGEWGEIINAHPMKSSPHRFILLLLVAALWTAIGSSCNTFRGLGRDIERTGQKIERAASR